MCLVLRHRAEMMLIIRSIARWLPRQDSKKAGDIAPFQRIKVEAQGWN